MDLFKTLSDMTRPDRDIQPDPPETKVAINEISFNDELIQIEFTAMYKYPRPDGWEYETKDFVVETLDLINILESIAEQP